MGVFSVLIFLKKDCPLLVIGLSIPASNQLIDGGCLMRKLRIWSCAIAIQEQ